MNTPGLGWPGIVRLGLVQAGIGSIIVLATSLLNRVMIVEYALPAMLPAGLVAWHHVLQLSRPRWGHGSDGGQRRTPWIIGGMGCLALGVVLAADATTMMRAEPVLGPLLAVVAFSMIGGGAAAAGTSMLALLAASVAPARRPAAAAITWIMMISGIVATAGIGGRLIDPFSPERLVTVVAGIALVALIVALLAVWGVERPTEAPVHDEPPVPFGEALAAVWADAAARRFTIFVFLSMLAYSMQDLILEPFAGLRFGYTAGESLSLGGVQNQGVLGGMLLVGLLGGGFARGGFGRGGGTLLRGWIVGGCGGSALALVGLAGAADYGPGWPIQLNVAALGFFNGMFAVAAIGSMMSLAGGGGRGREGVRMGVFGAAQAIGFAAGGFIGAAGVDALRALTGDIPGSFGAVFGVEAALFVAAALLALRIATPERQPSMVGVSA